MIHLPQSVTRGALCLIFSAAFAGLDASWAGESIVNPRIVTNSSIDTSSAATVVAQIITPDMSDEQKAVACWQFMLDHFYHWHPPQEASSPPNVRDFAKLINSYGYGTCFVNVTALVALWQAAGFQARSWHLGGHSVAEVFYNDDWHMFDADARAWHRDWDGEIASVDDLAADPSLFLAPLEMSDPYYPFAPPDMVTEPLMPWSWPVSMMELYLVRNVADGTDLPQAVTGHPMGLTLRPGEEFTLSADNQGLWNGTGPWYTSRRATPESLAIGPIDFYQEATYGNGELNWNVPLTDAKLAKDLFWTGTKGIKVGSNGLGPAVAGLPGVAVFRVWSPYVLVRGEVTAAFASAPAGRPAFEISTDGGYGWVPISPPAWTRNGTGKTSGTMDVTPHVLGLYEYLLRVTVSGTPLAGLELSSIFQNSQLAMPRLIPGENEITIFRDADEGHVQLVLAGPQMADERYLHSQGGDLILSDAAISPAEIGGEAFVVYRLEAPRALTGLSVGAQLTLKTAEDQFIEAEYSLDNGRTWSPAWEASEFENEEHEDYWDVIGEEDEEMAFGTGKKKEREAKNRFPSHNTTREVLVRFTMRRQTEFCAVNGVRLYAFYASPQSKDARLDARIVWRERHGAQWQEKERALTVARFPASFRLDCGGEEVRLARVVMAPAPTGNRSAKPGK